jgi:hypothetical protein
MKDLVYQTKGQDVDDLRCLITADCETYNSDAAKHLVRCGVLSGHLLGYQGGTCGDLLGNIKTWKLSASFSAVPMFPSTLVQEI